MKSTNLIISKFYKVYTEKKKEIVNESVSKGLLFNEIYFDLVPVNKKPSFIP